MATVSPQSSYQYKLIGAVLAWPYRLESLCPSFICGGHCYRDKVSGNSIASISTMTSLCERKESKTASRKALTTILKATLSKAVQITEGLLCRSGS